MPSFGEAFEKIVGIEHTNSSDVLHYNKKEKGLTFYGIYETAHPYWEGWEYIYLMLKKVNGNYARAGELILENDNLVEQVKKFYYDKFWQPLRLNLIESQHVAEEMFFFYMNTGNRKKTIRMAQLIVGAVPDGIMGRETVTKLNSFSEKEFDRAYDLKEMEYHARLVQANPKQYLLNLVGWIRRDVKI